MWVEMQLSGLNLFVLTSNLSACFMSSVFTTEY